MGEKQESVKSKNEDEGKKPQDPSPSKEEEMPKVRFLTDEENVEIHSPARRKEISRIYGNEWFDPSTNKVLHPKKECRAHLGWPCICNIYEDPRKKEKDE